MQTKILIFIITGILPFLCCLMPVLAEDYTLGNGDVLTITVYNYDELTTTVRISNNGDIVFPLIGEVHVGGLNITEAAQKIAVKLADGYIIRPQVSIFVKEFKSKQTIIFGQVKDPGVIELQGPINLLTLISRAGGLKEDAGDTVTIKRTIKGAQKTITVDLKALIEGKDTTQNIEILAGDTVSVSKGGTCYITGEVNQPNAYPCDRKTTVLKLISLAGGFNGKAAKSRVKIVRVVNGEKKILDDVELNTPLQVDDIVVVPESFF